MRKILFRGFHECENGTQIAVMNGTEHRGKWVFGCFWANEAGNCFIKVIRDLNGNFVGNPTTNDYEVIPETVGQFTGLTDKNGKKIFEGDTIRQNHIYHNFDMTGNVVFGKAAQFIIHHIYTNEEHPFRKWEKQHFAISAKGEVIGTIFDKEE